MCEIVFAKLLDILRSFHVCSGRYGSSFRNYLEVVVDYEFDTLHNPFVKLNSGKVIQGRELATRYDEDVLILMIMEMSRLNADDCEITAQKSLNNVQKSEGHTSDETQNILANGNKDKSDMEGTNCLFYGGFESEETRIKINLEIKLSVLQYEPYSRHTE